MEYTTWQAKTDFVLWLNIQMKINCSNFITKILCDYIKLKSKKKKHSECLCLAILSEKMSNILPRRMLEWEYNDGNSSS